MQKPLVEPPSFAATRSSQADLASLSIPIEVPSFQPNLRSLWDNKIVVNRFCNHIIILSLLFGLISFGSLSLSNQTLKAPVFIGPSLLPIVEVEPIDLGQPLQLPQQLNPPSDILQPNVVPFTAQTNPVEQALESSLVEAPSKPKIEITSYSVQGGDTVYSIAAKFGLAPETIHWANKELENNPDRLRIGQELIILPVDGVYHQVGGSDTIVSIAGTFKVPPEAIINFPLNNIDPDAQIIYRNQWLVVPGGTKPYEPTKYVSVPKIKPPQGAVYGTGRFQWPSQGRISQDYWNRHRALDISGWIGAPIYASDAGYVVSAQWDNRGYGRTVLIDHGNGYQTLYAHLSSIYVSAGDEVRKGEQIGEMGSTGNSTGPHLHFEVLYEGVQHNPWGFLP